MGSQDLYYLSEYLQKAMRNNTIPEDAEKELQELIDDLENVQNKLEKTLKKANKLIGRDDVSLDKV
jgi:exonuclease VII small subunit